MTFRLIGLGLVCFGLALLQPAAAYQIPATTKQCLLGIADDWDSSKVTLSWHVRKDGEWRQLGKSWPARLGKKGLAWGRGLHPLPEGAVTKREGDWKSPAGIFAIGGVWGYDKAIHKHPGVFYRRVTPRDLWVEDSGSKHYNRHLILDHEPRTAWEKQQQMKQDDPAHALKLFIAHNAPPRVVKGAGSSIFFHIWRDAGDRPTAGCTTMQEKRLRSLIASIEPQAKPLYVLLPKAEYRRVRKAWGLP